MAELPQSMTAIEIARPGGPEVLQPANRPVPQPAEGEILVRVAAAGVNRPDAMQRAGLYPPPPGASDIPGLEIAGEVVALGRGAAGVKVGDRVCALVTGGGYAEYCTAAAALCLPVPGGLSMSQAAALPETFFTVWTNVFQRGRLAAGETILVHGGASGIGTTAIQLARAFGARVLVTCSADKREACRKLGAELAIDYRAEDFVALAKEASGGRGVDLILDMIGGDYTPRNLEALAVEGRCVQIALQRGPKVEGFSLLPIMLKRLTLTGSTLRPRSVAEKAAIAAELRARVWPLLERGQVAPVMDSSFPLRQAAEAHARLEGGRHVGKIVLEAAG
jgi:putative PIG3 family NAD(P)H quinone oxidoreductase